MAPSVSTPLSTEEYSLARLVVRAACIELWPKAMAGKLGRPMEIWSQIGTVLAQLEAMLEMTNDEMLANYPILSLDSFRALVKDGNGEDGKDDEKDAENVFEGVLEIICNLRSLHQLFKSGKLRRATYRRLIYEQFNQQRMYFPLLQNRLFLSLKRLNDTGKQIPALEHISRMVGQDDVWSRLAEATRPGYNPQLDYEGDGAPGSVWVAHGKTSHRQLREGLFMFFGILYTVTVEFRTYLLLTNDLNTSFDRFARVVAIKQMFTVMSIPMSLEVAVELEPVAGLAEDALVVLEKGDKTYMEVLKEIMDLPDADSDSDDEVEPEREAQQAVEAETAPEERTAATETTPEKQASEAKAATEEAA